MSDSLPPHGLIQSMEFSRSEYWSGLPCLLQGIFLTQGLNPGLLHCRRILYQLSHQGSPFRGSYNNIPVSRVGLGRGNSFFMSKSPLTEPDKLQAAIHQQDTPGLRGLILVWKRMLWSKMLLEHLVQNSHLCLLGKEASPCFLSLAWAVSFSESLQWGEVPKRALPNAFIHTTFFPEWVPRLPHQGSPLGSSEKA